MSSKFLNHISVGLNPVCGFKVRDFWRVRVGLYSLILVDEPGFESGLKFGFSGFGPMFGPFLVEQVRVISKFNL